MRVNAKTTSPTTTTSTPAISGADAPASFEEAGVGACCVGTATAIVGAGVALGAAVVGAGLGVAVGAGLAVGVGSTVGATVGATVGRAVGTGVGIGVGTGVGTGVAAARTMTVPIIAEPWMPQM